MSDQIPQAETENPPKKIDGPWHQRVVATMLLVGLVATASQMIAMSLAGLTLAPGARETSTGGLVAVLSGIAMGVFTKNWQQFKKWIWLPLTVTALLCFALVGSFNSYQVKVVDQEAKPATSSIQPTGNYDVIRTQDRICEPGEDYFACISAHIASYNSSCANRSLSDSAAITCESLLSFIDDLEEQYANCGYNCRTQGEVGKWGWPYLQAKAETALQFDTLPEAEIYHWENCFFDLGIVQFGTCLTPDERAD